jgi:hypothetical protein
MFWRALTALGLVKDDPLTGKPLDQNKALKETKPRLNSGNKRNSPHNGLVSLARVASNGGRLIVLIHILLLSPPLFSAIVIQRQ